MKKITTYHLVLGEDMNHHGTLFAGRGVEWFVEAGYLSAATLLNSKDLVCAAIHELSFKRPVPAGETVSYTAEVIYAGRSSLVAYVSAVAPAQKELILDGFIRFVHVDQAGKAKAHGLLISAQTDSERLLQDRAKELSRKRTD